MSTPPQADERSVAAGQLDEFGAWLEAEAKKQERLKPFQDAVLTSGAIDAKLAGVRKLFNKLNAKSKPKPPAPPADEAAADDAGADGAGQEGDLPDPESILEEGTDVPGKDEL